MEHIILCLLWVFGLGAITYHRLNFQAIAASLWGGFLLTWFFYDLSTITIVLTIVILGVLTCGFFLTSVRQQYFSLPLITLFKKQLPKVSDTERVALEAGTVWWDGEIFSGNPNWEKLSAVGKPELTAEEAAFLAGPTHELCELINDWDIQQRSDLSAETWSFIKKNKFFGLIIPKAYGGLEFSALAHSEILTKIASKSLTASVMVSVPNSLGPAELLLHYGTEEQKDYYLPRLSKGEEIPCFALTNPEAGSDATSIPDTGVICKQKFEGKEVLGLCLNWNKRYITLAPVATLLGLAFQCKDPDHLLGDKEDLGITCALIPVHTKGITIGNRHLPLSAPFQNGPTQGKDVFIPLEWIIGGPKMIGQGWRMLVECLSCGRAISLPSIGTGMAKAAAAATGAYAHIRIQFKQPIGQFEGVQEALARIVGNVYIADSVRKMTAHVIDQGEAPSVLGAITKYHLTERSRQVGIDAMDIHGGKGIIMGPRNYLAYAYQNAPIGITVEGANILTRSMIIFGQGVMRSHPYILKTLQALQDTSTEQVNNFEAVFSEHVRSSLANLSRSFWFGLTKARLTQFNKPATLRSHYQDLSHASSAFALIADICLLVLGGKLKFKEMLSGRLGDLLSLQYIAAMCVKRYENEGSHTDDAVTLDWIMKNLLANYWQTMDEIIANLPNRLLRAMLRFFINPFCRQYAKPRDALTKSLATMLITPCEARDRLLQGIYLDNTPNSQVGYLEHVLKLVVAAEPIEKRLRDARVPGKTRADKRQNALIQKVITGAEFDILAQAEHGYLEVIQVDDFPPQFFDKK